MVTQNAVSFDTLPKHPTRSSRRFLLKAISWRVVGTLDTFILSMLMLSVLGPLFGIHQSTGSHARTAGLIAISEVVTKIALFYGHEWLWARLRWAVGTDGQGRAREHHRRSVVKALSWRVFASLDTTVLALIYTGNLKLAVSIGGAEVATKLVLYYFHERAWERIPLGKTGGATGTPAA